MFSLLICSYSSSYRNCLLNKRKGRQRRRASTVVMVVSVNPNENSLWNTVLEMTKAAQEKNSDPLFWAVQLASTLNSAGVSLPSTHLAHLLVSHICWDNHVPIAWKFLDKALTVRVVPPFLVLAILSSRFSFQFCIIMFVLIILFSEFLTFIYSFGLFTLLLLFIFFRKI